MRLAKENKKARITESERQLEEVTGEINEIVGKTLVGGGMIAEGRKRAAMMLERVEGLIEYAKKLKTKNATVVTDITDRREKDQKFFLGYENYQRDLDMKIKVYSEDLEKFLTMARNAISSFNPKKLPTVGISKDEGVLALYVLLFELLYEQPAADFDWTVFKKLALAEESEDFQKRLAQFDIATLDNEKAIELKRCKDNDFSRLAEFDDLIDLLTWCDWMYECFLLHVNLSEKNNQLADLKRQYDTKTVQTEASKKFLAQEQNTNRIFGDFLRQLEVIKGKLINVLNNSDNENVDMIYGKIEAIRRELEPTANIPVALLNR